MYIKITLNDLCREDLSESLQQSHIFFHSRKIEAVYEVKAQV